MSWWSGLSFGVRSVLVQKDPIHFNMVQLGLMKMQPNLHLYISAAQYIMLPRDRLRQIILTRGSPYLVIVAPSFTVWNQIQIILHCSDPYWPVFLPNRGRDDTELDRTPPWWYCAHTEQLALLAPDITMHKIATFTPIFFYFTFPISLPNQHDLRPQRNTLILGPPSQYGSGMNPP